MPARSVSTLKLTARRRLHHGEAHDLRRAASRRPPRRARAASARQVRTRPAASDALSGSSMMSSLSIGTSCRVGRRGNVRGRARRRRAGWPPSPAGCRARSAARTAPSRARRARADRPRRPSAGRAGRAHRLVVGVEERAARRGLPRGGERGEPRLLPVVARRRCAARSRARSRTSAACRPRRAAASAWRGARPARAPARLRNR